MTCRELNELLADYLDRELAPDVRGSLESHLVRCPACAAYVASYQETIREVRASHPDDASPEAGPSDLAGSILDATIGAPRSRRR